MNCINCFSSKKVFEKHKPGCMVINVVQASEYSKDGDVAAFKSLNKALPVPFVIYADLKALLVELQNKNEKENEKESYTIKTHEHKTGSFGYKVVCLNDVKYSYPFKKYRGKDVVYKFFAAILNKRKK